MPLILQIVVIDLGCLAGPSTAAAAIAPYEADSFFWIANLSASFWQVVPASVFYSSMLPPQTECRTGARNRVEPLRYYHSDGVYDKKRQQMFSNGKLSGI